MIKKAAKISLEALARIMKKGFDKTHSLIKLTRMEMAKEDEQAEIKSTVDSIWTMLDDEARFIQLMRAEYPLIIKRLQRIERKLGLPSRSVME